MRKVTGGCVVVLAVALIAAGCDKNIPTPTNPTEPTNPVTETFTGPIAPNGGRSFAFSTAAAGFLTATLKSLSPDDAIEVGLALGTWNGVTCQMLINNDATLVGQVVSGNASGAGQLCVRIYDAHATITQTNNFEIVVVHP